MESPPIAATEGTCGGRHSGSVAKPESGKRREPTDRHAGTTTGHDGSNSNTETCDGLLTAARLRPLFLIRPFSGLGSAVPVSGTVVVVVAGDVVVMAPMPDETAGMVVEVAGVVVRGTSRGVVRAVVGSVVPAGVSAEMNANTAAVVAAVVAAVSEAEAETAGLGRGGSHKAECCQSHACVKKFFHWSSPGKVESRRVAHGLNENAEVVPKCGNSRKMFLCLSLRSFQLIEARFVATSV